MSATDVEAKVGDFTVTLYNRATGLIHSVHNLADVDVKDAVELAKKEAQDQQDPSGTSQAHIGYTDGLVGAVTDTATGEGVEAPRDKTQAEQQEDRIKALEESLARYQQNEQNNPGGVSVQSPQPFQGSGQGLPLSPSTSPNTPVNPPSPAVNEGPTIPAAPPFQGPEV